MSSSGVPTMTIDEMVESLTGFDEIAIEKHFNGFDIYNDGQTKSVRAMRALAFVLFRREGDSDPEAVKRVQGMTFKDVSALFLDNEPEVDADDPQTESGKDSALPA